MTTWKPVEPVYFDEVFFAGQRFELWLEAHPGKTKRSRTLRWWYAKPEGGSEDDFRNTCSDSPSGALGLAILNLPVNDAVANRIYGQRE